MGRMRTWQKNSRLEELVTRSPAENVIIVHWHDLGRHLGVYGYSAVSSPRADALAAEGILFTRAHAVAPL